MSFVRVGGKGKQKPDRGAPAFLVHGAARTAPALSYWKCSTLYLGHQHDVNVHLGVVAAPQPVGRSACCFGLVLRPWFGDNLIACVLFSSESKPYFLLLTLQH